jgi:hypothetical protein
MEHDLKKILLIDDSPSNLRGSGNWFYSNICDDLRPLIDYSNSLDNRIKIINEFEVILSSDITQYEIVLLHASYNSPLLNPSQLSSLKSLLKNLVTYSGGSNINIDLRITSREQMYKSLERSIEAYKIMAIFPLITLFSNNINRFYPLLDRMQDILEEVGKEGLLGSREFHMYIRILRFDVSAVVENYRKNKTEEELNEKIIEWKLNNSL